MTWDEMISNSLPAGRDEKINKSNFKISPHFALEKTIEKEITESIEKYDE